MPCCGAPLRAQPGVAAAAAAAAAAGAPLLAVRNSTNTYVYIYIYIEREIYIYIVYIYIYIVRPTSLTRSAIRDAGCGMRDEPNDPMIVRCNIYGFIYPILY